VSNIEAYSVQKPVSRNFPRSRVILSGIDAQWDGDLASMENVAKYNDGIHFLLVLIDIFFQISNRETINKQEKRDRCKCFEIDIRT